MRRLLIIFLLAILPIQAALAAACAYCPDSCMTEAGTATTADVANTADVSFSDAATPADEDDCGRCQPGSSGMLPSLSPSHLSAPPENRISLGSGAWQNSVEPDRPERPNWEGAA